VHFNAPLQAEATKPPESRKCQSGHHRCLAKGSSDPFPTHPHTRPRPSLQWQPFNGALGRSAAFLTPRCTTQPSNCTRPPVLGTCIFTLRDVTDPAAIRVSNGGRPRTSREALHITRGTKNDVLQDKEGDHRRVPATLG
jgi:hypothetical protein